MSATITLNPGEIKQISQPHTVSSLGLRVLARRVERECARAVPT